MFVSEGAILSVQPLIQDNFLVGLFFSTPKSPIVDAFPQTAPQPALEASVVRMRSELPWLKALVEVRILYTH